MSVNPKLGSAIVAGVCVMIGLATLVQSPSGSKSVQASPGLQGRNAANPAPGGVIAGLGLIEPEGGAIDQAALMPGVISKVLFKEGEAIRQGELLVEIVNDDLKAKVAQATASVAIRTAELRRIEKGPRPQEILKAEAQLREEEGNLKLLQMQYSRRQKLSQEGAVSTETFNATASALTASQERRNAAQQQLSILREGARTEEIEAARGELKLAEHQLAEAQAALAKSQIRATSNGVVLRRYKEPGEAVSTQPAQAVIQIGDLSKLVVRTQIDEDDIGALRIGQPARISAAALGDRKVEGRVQRISPRLGAKTITSGSPTEKRDSRVLDVIVALDPGSALPINLRVDVVIDVSNKTAMAAATDSKSPPVSWDLRR